MHWHFDVCLQTTIVIKYLEKQHDCEIGTTVVKLWQKKTESSFHHERINRMWHMQTSHTDPSDRCKTCALTCSSDLVFVFTQRCLKSSASLFESYITEMSCTHLSAEEWMIIQLFSLLILKWILLLSVLSLSFTLWFSLVLCMSFPSSPVLLSNRDTHAHTEQTASPTCATAICRLPAEPGDLMKEKEEDFKKSAFYHMYSSWHVETYICIKSQRKMSISRCTWVLNSKY